MKAKEFYSKIYDIIVNSETPEEQQKLSNRFFKELESEYTEYAKEYARIKCLEAIRNTRYAAIDIVCQDEVIDEVHAIQNIPNQDVMPDI